MKHLSANFFRQILKPPAAYILCLSIIVTCIFSLPVTSYATSAEVPSTSTQDKLDATNERLDALRASQNILTSDLSDLNTQLDLATADLTRIQNDITDKENEISQLEVKIDEAIAYENEQYEQMKLRIKYMYENGSSASAINMLIASGNMEEFLTRAEYISKISLYDRQMLEKYHDNYTTLVQAQEQLKADRENLIALGAQAADQKRNVENLVADTQQKIDTSSVEIAEAERLALEYEKQIEAEIIARQEAERKAAEEAARKAAEEAARLNAQNNVTIPDGMTLLAQQTSHAAINYTAADLAMLAAIIECEAANQPYQGKLAVGSVVINRINNPRWPNTMSEVLYQPNQFTPVRSGRFAIVLARGANASCTQAALEVLNGGINIDALFFHVVREGETGGTVIADHIFF